MFVFLFSENASFLYLYHSRNFEVLEYCNVMFNEDIIPVIDR